MPRTARVGPGGLVYHVINRGVGRQQLFFDDERKKTGTGRAGLFDLGKGDERLLIAGPQECVFRQLQDVAEFDKSGVDFDGKFGIGQVSRRE